MASLTPGLKFESRYKVPSKSLVPELFDFIAICADMPPVLATGYMAGLMECACLEAIRPHMDWPAEQTVGTHISFSHLAASIAGDILRITGELTAVNGRRLTFEVSAWDGRDQITQGTHERAIIDGARFRAGIDTKADALGLPRPSLGPTR